MARSTNPAVVAAKWARNMQASGEAMKAGVNAVTVNPAQQAIAAKDRWLSGIQKAATEGKFEDGLAGVTTEGWKQSMIDKGVPNMVNGSRTALPKVTKVMATLLPHTERVRAEVASMPKGTLEDGIARSAAAIRLMAQYKKPR